MAEVINHKARAHSLLSPSGSAKWIGCPPSVMLEESVSSSEDSNGSTEYSVEGTLAHEFAEMILRNEVMRDGSVEDDPDYECVIESPFYYDGMEDDVRVYTDYCAVRLFQSKIDWVGREKDVTAHIEAKVPLTFLVKPGDPLRDMVKDDGGSVDFAIVTPDKLIVIDLKFGRGVRVSAEENSQLRIYGLGLYHALLTDIRWGGIKEIETVIVQPRISSIPSTQTNKVEDLTEWLDKTVRPAAAMALQGKGELNPGKHCKWCKVKARCPAQRDLAFELAADDFMDDPALLSDKELLEVRKKAPVIMDYLSSVNSYLFDQLMLGRKVDGIKLVEGKANRRWKDETNAIKTLQDLGFEEDDILKKTIQPIGKIEKLVGKKKFPDIVGMYVEKPKGQPQLADADDPRDEYSSADAADDFLD